MSFRSTAAVLTAIKDRIEALTPSPQFSDDDAFRVVASLDDNRMNGHRSVLLVGSGGIRKVDGNRTCTEWQTQVEILIAYNQNVQAEDGEETVLQRAIQDAEDILADLYTWATTTDGIYRIRPDLAIPQLSGDGEMLISRSIAIDFNRT